MSWREELENLKKQGLYRSLKDLPKGTINFCSNDYLGLSHDKRVLQGSIDAVKKNGAGSGAARLVSGNFSLLSQLEKNISAWRGTQETLIFNSGYQANIGAIPVLAGEGDLIFSDELNHASLIDGCRLSKAKTLVYRHQDMDHLEELLKNTATHKNSKILIVTESVFSMEGDLAPLDDLKKMAERYDALLYVDEAHAVGLFGENGEGRVGKNPPSYLVSMGTLGKSFGAYGAFISGTKTLKEYLINKARSFIFSTALPPAAIGASLAALKIIQGREGKALRRELWSNVDLVNQQLGLSQGDSPIFSVQTGEAAKTMKISEKLLKEKIYVQGIRPPTVPAGTSRLRLTVSARHTVPEIYLLVKTLQRLLCPKTL